MIDRTFELRISDEWWPRFQPVRPVLVQPEEPLVGNHATFRIVSGAIVDSETGDRLTELTIGASMDGTTLGHLAGTKVSGEGKPLGRALLVEVGKPMPDWISD